MTSLSNRFYITGGALGIDARSYIERSTDQTLLRALLQGEYCYVLTPRQMGKTSLLFRIEQHLKARGYLTSVVDLTGIGTEVSQDEWYLSIVDVICNDLEIEGVHQWWQALQNVSSVRRFDKFIEEFLLTLDQPTTIFIDEIDTTLSLPFSDDFFASLRLFYQKRSRNPKYERLRFVLLGVATPSELIKDETKTPFNVGERFELNDLTFEEAAVLREGLEGVPFEQQYAIIEHVYAWTDGHPYLTQKLCSLIAESDLSSWDQNRIDNLVVNIFTVEPDAHETNLQFMQSKIRNYHWYRRYLLLRLYKRVYAGEIVQIDNQSYLQSQLRLIGLLKPQRGKLTVRNKIYQTVFDQNWISENTPRVIPYTFFASIGFVLLLLVGLIGTNIYNRGRTNQVLINEYMTILKTAEEPSLEAPTLSRLFTVPDTEAASKGREWFSELSRDEQLLVIQSAKPEIIVPIVHGIAPMLLDTPSNNELLKVLVQKVPGGSATELKLELDDWVNARNVQELRSRRAFLETERLRNSPNPAIHFDYAMVLIGLGEYQLAAETMEELLGLTLYTKRTLQEEVDLHRMWLIEIGRVLSSNVVMVEVVADSSTKFARLTPLLLPEQLAQIDELAEDMMVATNEQSVESPTSSAQPTNVAYPVVTLPLIQEPYPSVIETPESVLASVSYPGDIVYRNEWCTHPACNYTSVKHYPVSHIVIHHSVSNNSNTNWEANVRAIWTYHTFQKDWGDLGYNYAIDPNGMIYEGHAGGDGVIGRHSAGLDAGSVGIAMLGTFSNELPSDAALESLIDLVAWITLENDLDLYESTQPPLRIPSHGVPHFAGHSDIYGTTVCPGGALHNHLPEIRDAVYQRLNKENPYRYVSVFEEHVILSDANWFNGPKNCGFNSGSLYTFTTTNPELSINSAEWLLNIEQAGQYEVGVFIPFCNTGEQDTAEAHYEIKHVRGTEVIIVDQSANLGMWVTLGTFDFAVGQGSVLLKDLVSDSDDNVITFDTVRYRLVAENSEVAFQSNDLLEFATSR